LIFEYWHGGLVTTYWLHGAFEAWFRPGNGSIDMTGRDFISIGHVIFSLLFAAGGAAMGAAWHRPANRR
jgi:hypothetical protein